MALMDTAPLSPSYGTVTNLPLCLLNWAPDASDAKNKADGRCGVGLQGMGRPLEAVFIAAAHM